MKRNSKKLIKVLSPLACLTVASVPLCITLTSCSASAGGLKSLNTAQDSPLPTSLNSITFNNSSASVVQLLNGDKNFHGGNYCIILGSNVNEKSNIWFCGKKPDANYYRNYFQNDIFQGSPFIDAYEHVQAYAKNKDCAMLTYLDIQTQNEAIKLPTVGEEFFPFDKKWSEQDQKTAEKWDDEHDTNIENTIKKDQYIRNDKSAKDMRTMISLLSTLFGDLCKDIANKMPFLMVWKEGVPQKDSFVQLTETNFSERVIQVWEKEEEKK